MNVSFIDLRREYAAIGPEIEAALRRVTERGYFLFGPEIQNFERQFAEYCAVPFAVGVNSGTDALYLALLAGGIGAGDEVIVPANTAIPTAMAVLMAGATPVLADSDDNFLIDLALVEQLITPRTKAIIPVHLYGRACDMGRVMALASQHQLIVIEDCAQAVGAQWGGKKVGSWGDFGCFSFYPTKNIGAYGDGGMVTARRPEQAEKLRALRFYGQTDTIYRSDMFGVNSRLDELQAAVLGAKLPHLPEWNARRGELVGIYRRELADTPWVRLPAAAPAASHVYHLLVARVLERDQVRAFLAECGVQTLVHYPWPLHLQPVFQRFAPPGGCPRAEAQATEIVSLPLYPYLQPEEIKFICATLKSYRRA